MQGLFIYNEIRKKVKKKFKKGVRLYEISHNHRRNHTRSDGEQLGSGGQKGRDYGMNMAEKPNKIKPKIEEIASEYL